ncbi:MAG: hypothetical protein QF890_12405 [Myxococcota bacterium]|nr:hypothetical protein [Deltaproteobacteria bacterium]MCP4239743.1 hypothetical protein [bacterium]MDP6074461.1 hypothetical protein [Myxococcota bacterium]MDP6241705.1 hypothetical protein [Myxococcota bacterium]MDP7073846.1 hypothetical protein [Myxococcota bacterium]
MSIEPHVNRLEYLDEELETILTSFGCNCVCTEKGLRDRYEKAKREQWNATEQLAWDRGSTPSTAPEHRP